jgi:hypothetical protein
VLAKHWPGVTRWGDVRTFPVGDPADWHVELLRISAQGSLWLRIPSAFSTMTEAARSTESCGRLPRSGTYANGTLSPLPTLVLLTEGSESGLWPTPTAGDANGSGSRNTATSKAHSGISLTDAVLGDGGRGRLLPTPNTVDAKGGTRNGPGQTQLCHLVGGRLNPQWVEWLMGFPIGWTDCDASETPSCPRSPK